MSYIKRQRSNHLKYSISLFAIFLFVLSVFAQNKPVKADSNLTILLKDSVAVSKTVTVDSTKKDTSLAFIADPLSQILKDPVGVNADNQMTSGHSENRDNFSFRNLQTPSVESIITPGKIIWTLIFLFIGYIIIRLLSGLLNRLGERSTKYRIAIKRLVPIVKIIGWIFIIFIIIQGIVKPPMAMVLGFFTSVGVAVGFAAQDLLKNVFGGLMILFDRPFQIGDKIEVGESYGEVIKIGLRSTRIVTADDSEVSVPNGEMMNSSISNSNSGQTNCQVVAEIYLPLDIDTQKARKIAMEAALVSKYIYLNKPVSVIFVNEMHERKSLLKMRLKAYVSDIRFEFVFKSDMTEIVLKELIKEGLLKPGLV